MRRYFAIGIDPVTEDQSNSIRDWLSGDYGWWHWIDGLWLISTSTDLDVTTIRDKICELAPNVNNLVLEVHPVTWSGFGPSSEKRNMFDWLKNDWKK